MLAKRIIPVILNKHSSLIKGRGFAGDRVVGHAYQASRIHSSRYVDELILLDITATTEDREPDYSAVKALADSCFSPLTVGGGVSKWDHIRKLLQSGADKVSICTHALLDMSCIRHFSESFGRQCITIAVDTMGGYVYSSSGKVRHEMGPVEWARLSQQLGAGEILLTSIDRDGTMCGYDLELIRQVSDAVNIPVIANGGCGSYEDMYQAIECGASAVAAGALWVFSDATPKEAAKYLNKKGVEVRL